jgi:hypothetical protein
MDTLGQCYELLVGFFLILGHFKVLQIGNPALVKQAKHIYSSKFETPITVQQILS